VALIRDGTYPNVHSLLVVKDGKLAFEQYFPGDAWSPADGQAGGDVEFDAGTLHYMASVTKSITSALVGIAIDRGAIGGVDEKLFSFFPEYAHLQDGGKEALTLEHLLTMTSRLSWNENELPYTDPANDFVGLYRAPDPLAYVLGRPLEGEPGQGWEYNGGSVDLLGAVVARTTGQGLDAFAEEHLFGPLGIDEYRWDFVRPDFIDAAGGLHLRPRDMAMLGLLYLNGGEWNGRRVVPEAWVETATQPHASVPGGGEYGYLWWRSTYALDAGAVQAFSAIGWGGQWIIVFPELDMVVVFTGGNYAGEDPVERIVARHLLPAVEELNH
jgi:CubicO group peptidase (beta-lactamase class C family)